MAVRHDNFAVGTIRIHRVNASGTQLKHKQTMDSGVGVTSRLLFLMVSDMRYLYIDLTRSVSMTDRYRAANTSHRIG